MSERAFGHRGREVVHLGLELPFRQRPIVLADQREVDADLAVDHEVPAGDPFVVTLRPQSGADGHHFSGRIPRSAELHPDVPVGRFLAAVEQVGLHGALVTGERVESARFDSAIQNEREQHLKGLGLARSVRSAQHQPAVGEDELVVAVVPQIHHTAPGGPESVRPGLGGAGVRHAR
jgi:hypothetical protein